MTWRNRTVVLIALLCVVCLLASTFGFLVMHGDVTYRLWTQIRPYGEPNLKEVTLATRAYTLDELNSLDGVTFSNLLMLVNNQNPLPDGYEAVLEEYNGARMHPDMVAPYVALRDAVEHQTGVRIFVSSDYRTPEEQAEILAESGDSVAAGVGCSEHEAGLALDVYAPYFGGESFLKSRAGRMVGEVCAEYGFIIRYPLGGGAVTGIDYEPWHLRYVGAPHARIMTDAGLTLEEYVERLSPNVWYESGEYLISRQSADMLSLPETFSDCMISPDNTGYYLITVKNDFFWKF